MRYFGSSGIRGVYGEKVTPELGLRLGSALGSMGNRAVVGIDHRATSPLLSCAVQSGLASSGADVLDLGLVPTPTVGFHTKRADLGVMVTASHNPPEYNGFKLWNPDGLSFVTGQMKAVEALLDGDLPASPWDGAGRVERVEGAIRDHVEAIASALRVGNPPVVAVDCGGGATSEITPLLLTMLGCKVHSINTTFDPFFSSRPSEPTREALSALTELVRKTGADLGIAHDGDGDRMVAVSGSGEYLGGYELMQVFAKHGGFHHVVAPVNASMAFEESVKGRIRRTKVGDVFVGEALKDGGDFGCEPSGTWIFPEFNLCPDGVFAAGKLVEMVSALGPDILAPGKRYPLVREKIPVRNDWSSCRVRVMEVLGGAENVTLIDGARGDYPWGWVLVRPSGTEPVVRITLEARTEAFLEAEGKPLLEKLREALR